MEQRKHYQRYPASVRQSALERMGLGVNVSELAEQLGVHRSTLYVWKQHAEATVSALEVADRAPLEQRDYQIRELRSKVAALEGELGRAALETRFFRSALRRVEESRQSSASSGATASSPRSAVGPNRKAN